MEPNFIIFGSWCWYFFLYIFGYSLFLSHDLFATLTWFHIVVSPTPLCFFSSSDHLFSLFFNSVLWRYEPIILRERQLFSSVCCLYYSMWQCLLIQIKRRVLGYGHSECSDTMYHLGVVIICPFEPLFFILVCSVC